MRCARTSVRAVGGAGGHPKPVGRRVQEEEQSITRFRGISAGGIAVTALVAVCTAVAAQPTMATAGTATVSGQIKSAGSGEPLPGVAVCVTEPSAEKGSGDCAPVRGGR